MRRGTSMGGDGGLETRPIFAYSLSALYPFPESL